MLETTAIVAISGVPILAAVALWCWSWDRVHVRVRSGVGDDRTAAEMFLRVLRTAKESVVIQDDGNGVEGTVFKDERVINAIREQLEERKALKIRCIFSDRKALALVKCLGTEYPGRFQAFYRRGRGPIGDVHYEIADGGALGHLSVQGRRQRERSFKVLDCTQAATRTRRSVFGKYLRQFERDLAMAE